MVLDGTLSDEDVQDLLTDVLHWLNSDPESALTKEDMLQMVVHAWSSYHAEIKGE